MMGQFAGSDKTGAMRSINAVTRMLSRAIAGRGLLSDGQECYGGETAQEEDMIVAIVTFHLARPTTVGEIAKTFQATASKYQGIPGLLRKNYFVSEDGRRAGGIYVWASRADADRVYTAEWKTFVEGKYGTPPVVEYLHSPVMVDNRDGSISVAA
jgi:Putative mono-oxygenase ydhR